MLITQSVRNGVSVLSLSGKFDFSCRHDFREALHVARDMGNRHIVLDLKDVVFIDSAGLGLMSVGVRDLEQSGQVLSIANPQETAQKIFELANFGKMLSIYSSIEDAVAARVSAPSATVS